MTEVKEVYLATGVPVGADRMILTLAARRRDQRRPLKARKTPIGCFKAALLTVGETLN